MSDSAVGGYLLASTTGLEGQDLQRFLQQWLVGMTGLDPTLVRPRWQPEPPNIPVETVAWLAFGIGNTSADVFPYVVHDPDLNDGQGGDRLQRHEEFDMLCSAYDLGSTGQADAVMSLLRDGTAISQNRDYLRSAGIALIEAGDMLSVPSLLMERWNYRVDMTLRLRRQIDREYPVFHILSASGGVFFDKLPRGIVVRFEAVTIQLPQDVNVTQSTVNVPPGAQDVQILPENLNRQYLAIINTGISRANLNFGVAAVVDVGVPLDAAAVQGDPGGSFIMENRVSTQAIHAISQAGTTLVVLEG
jgi:hypothetical protein